MKNSVRCFLKKGGGFVVVVVVAVVAVVAVVVVVVRCLAVAVEKRWFRLEVDGSFSENIKYGERF